MFSHSTPVNALRPRTNLDESLNTSTGNFSSLRRRTNGANISGPHQLILPESNDDVERQEHIRQKQLRRSVANLNSSKSDTLNTSLNESINRGTTYNDEEMIVQIKICNKLFNENKITLKNAWQVQVIDLLNQLVRKDKSTNNNNADILQTASQCLEVAGKVYSLRVDSLHSEALRLAVHFARTFKQNAKDQRDDGDNSDGAIENDPEYGQKKKGAKKKKKRSMGLSKEIVINDDPKSWSAPLPKLESAIFSAKNDVAMSTNENLFTNQLKMNHSGYKFMLLSKEKAWIKYAQDETILEPQRQFTIEIPKLNDNFYLCPPFKDFVLDEWDPDKEKQELELRSASQQQVWNDVCLDENGVPLHELDESLHDFFADQNNFDDDNDREEEEALVPQLRGEVEFITDFMPRGLVSDLERSEYSHNTLLVTATGRIEQIWAGPSHWKLKYIRPNSKTYSGKDFQKPQKPRKRKVIEDEPIDAHVTVLNTLPEVKIGKLKKKTTFVDKQKQIIPLPDILCKEILENWNNLMTLPLMKPVKKDKADFECGLSNYNYQNPTDEQFCPNNDDDEPDLADDIFGNDDREGENTIFQENVIQQCALGDNLIDAPETVALTYVPFALRAKRMDMRKLKLAIWKVLAQSDKDEIVPELPIIRTTFGKLFKNLPSMLPETMKQELSCALAFSALLHLANDLYLVMPKRENDISDFDIYK